MQNQCIMIKLHLFPRDSGWPSGSFGGPRMAVFPESLEKRWSFSPNFQWHEVKQLKSLLASIAFCCPLKRASLEQSRHVSKSTTNRWSEFVPLQYDFFISGYGIVKFLWPSLINIFWCSNEWVGENQVKTLGLLFEECRSHYSFEAGHTFDLLCAVIFIWECSS